MLLDDPSKFTLTRERIASLNSSEVPRQHLMAGAVIATVPVMALFLGLEKFKVTRGLTAGVRERMTDVFDTIDAEPLESPGRPSAYCGSNDRGRVYRADRGALSLPVELGQRLRGPGFRGLSTSTRAWTEIETLFSGQWGKR